MSWDVAAEREKLYCWEERLREEVGEGGLLLGELGYTEQHMEEIGGLLFRTTFYRVQQRASIDIKLRQVSTYWPLTFALYLVLEGIHNYGEEGLYWHGPKKRSDDRRQSHSALRSLLSQNPCPTQLADLPTESGLHQPYPYSSTWGDTQ